MTTITEIVDKLRENEKQLNKIEDRILQLYLNRQIIGEEEFSKSLYSLLIIEEYLKSNRQGLYELLIKESELMRQKMIWNIE